VIAESSLGTVAVVVTGQRSIGDGSIDQGVIGSYICDGPVRIARVDGAGILASVLLDADVC
jgi:hypothetical protein